MKTPYFSCPYISNYLFRLFGKFIDSRVVKQRGPSSKSCLSLAAVLGLYLLLLTPVSRADIVTTDTIGHFSLSGSSLQTAFACNALHGTRRLGTLRFNSGAPAPIIPGALFSELSPSAAQRIRNLENTISSTTRQARVRKGSKNRRRLTQRLTQARSELATLSNLVQWCNTFAPMVANPGGQRLSAPPPSGGSSRPAPPSDRSPQPPSQRGDDFPSVDDLLGDDSQPGQTFECSTRVVRGTVSGDASAIVTLGNDSWLRSQDSASGAFAFTDVPEGTYLLTAERAGYSFGPAHQVVVRADADCPDISFTGRALKTPGVYAFRWRERDLLRSGTEQASLIEANSTDQPLVAKSASLLDSAEDGDQTINSASSAELQLALQYKVQLDSSELTWSNEYSQRLLEAFSGMWTSLEVKPSVWTLTEEHLNKDIEFTESDQEIRVRISAEAFRYAQMGPAPRPGEKGEVLSFRLSTALMRFASRNGRDRGVIESVLMNQFHVHVYDDPVMAAELAATTTKESAAAFQRFSGEELIAITSALANLPRVNAMLNGAIAIVRRANGVPNPTFRDSMAVIPYPGVRKNQETTKPYLEYNREAFRIAQDADSIFETPTFNSLHPSLEPLLLGTLAAYGELVWDHSPSGSSLREEWTDLGGWMIHLFTQQWRSTDPTQVGSMLPYGVRLYSPQGDFATSLAQYISAPNELAFRSPSRFEFIRTKVMHGLKYVRAFRDDLKVPVYNLRPDLSLPGKVKEASIVIKGGRNETKKYQLNIKLQGTDPMLHGANFATAWLRLVPDPFLPTPSGARDVMMHLYPVNPDPTYGASLELVARGELPKFIAGGYYELRYIGIADIVGNVRFQYNDVGLGFFLDNDETPPEPAKLVKGSTTLAITETEVEGTRVPAFKVQFRATNPERLHGVGISIDGMRGTTGNYVSRSAWDYAIAGDQVTVTIPVSPHIRSDEYGISWIRLQSVERDEVFYFSRNIESNDSSYELMPLVTLTNTNEDTTKPVVNLNRIKVESIPENPEVPNGATSMVVTMYAKDDLAGLCNITFCLRSPLDRVSCYNPYIQSAYSPRPTGTSNYEEHKTYIRLPAGSIGGTWGIDYIYTFDKVGNREDHALSEIVKVPVENNM